MIGKNFINNIYKDLCARLGELQIQKDQIDKEITNILAQIALLNSMAPSMESLEKEIKSGEAVVLGDKHE